MNSSAAGCCRVRPDQPSFLMYESASGERFTLYASRAKNRRPAQMRTRRPKTAARCTGPKDNVGYVLSGPTDKDRLNQIARRFTTRWRSAGGGSAPFAQTPLSSLSLSGRPSIPETLEDKNEKPRRTGSPAQAGDGRPLIKGRG